MITKELISTLIESISMPPGYDSYHIENINNHFATININFNRIVDTPEMSTIRFECERWQSEQYNHPYECFVGFPERPTFKSIDIIIKNRN